MLSKKRKLDRRQSVNSDNVYNTFLTYSPDSISAYNMFNTKLKRKRLNSLPQLPLVDVKYERVKLTMSKVKNINVVVIPSPHSSCDQDGHYKFQIKELFANRFIILSLLGQGTFGKVVHCYDKLHQSHVAIKIIRNIQKYRDAARIELRILSTLKKFDPQNQNHCIHLRECFDFKGHICIVTDLLKISLYDFLENNSFISFPGSHIQAISKQLIRSVTFLHDLGLIHTDLKPENILLHDDSFKLKKLQSSTILSAYLHLSKLNNVTSTTIIDNSIKNDYIDLTKAETDDIIECDNNDDENSSISKIEKHTCTDFENGLGNGFNSAYDSLDPGIIGEFTGRASILDDFKGDLNYDTLSTDSGNYQGSDLSNSNEFSSGTDISGKNRIFSDFGENMTATLLNNFDDSAYHISTQAQELPRTSFSEKSSKSKTGKLKLISGKLPLLSKSSQKSNSIKSNLSGSDLSVSNLASSLSSSEYPTRKLKKLKKSSPLSSPTSSSTTKFNSKVKLPKLSKILNEPLIQIIDFGSAVFNDEYHSSIVSTRHYRAPEIVLGVGWSYSCDCWSIGCILVEMIIGEPLFKTHDNLEHLAMIEKICGYKINKSMVKLSKLKKNQCGLDYFTDGVKKKYKKYDKNEFDQIDKNLIDEFSDSTENEDMESDNDSSCGEDGFVFNEISNDNDDSLTLKFPTETTPDKFIKSVQDLDRIDIFISKRIGLDINLNYSLSANYQKNKHLINYGNFTFWWFFIDLLKKLFVIDPEMRCSAENALNHPWFNLGIKDEGTMD